MNPLSLAIVNGESPSFSGGSLLSPQQDMGILRPEDRASIKRNAILQVAAHLLMAGGRSPNQQGTLANIGSALAGLDLPGAAQSAIRMRAVVDELNQRSNARDALKDIAKRYPVLPGATAEERYAQLTNIVTEAATIPGLEDWVGKMSNVLAQTRPEKAQRPRYTFRGDVLVNGKPHLFRINEDDPTDKTDLGPTAGNIGGLAGQVAGQRRVLADIAGDAIKELDKVGQTAPSLWEQVFASPLGQKLGGQAMLGEQRQLQNQAERQFSEAVLRFTTGAAAPETEVQRYLQLFSLRFGDKAATISRKMQAQRSLLASLQHLAERGEFDPNEAVRLLQQQSVGISGPTPVPASGESSGGGSYSPDNPFKP